MTDFEEKPGTRAGENDWTMFKMLTPKMELQFRLKAREDYKAGDLINPLWHPVYRDECDKINREGGIK